MSENLELSEQCAEMAQTATDATIRSIFARMSELVWLEKHRETFHGVAAPERHF